MVLHQEELVSVAEAALQLRVSVPTIKRWLRDGRLPGYHLGPRSIRIRRGDLEKVLSPLQAALPENSSGTSPTPSSCEPLNDAEVEQALRALAAADELRARMRAERGGTALDSSTPLLRAARESRPTTP